MLLLIYTGPAATITTSAEQIIVSDFAEIKSHPQDHQTEDESSKPSIDHFSWFPTHSMSFVKRQRGRPKKTGWNTEIEPGVRKVVGDQFDDMEMVGETHRRRIINEFKRLVERGVQVKRTIQLISDRYELPYVQVYSMVESII